MSSTVEQIKERLSVNDVISSYVKLERAGANFKARCPFHNERTPSFFVSPERGTYHCFGCDKGGDIFSFVQEIEGIDFLEALKTLASRAGVVIKEFDGKEAREKERLYQVMEEAVRYYAGELSKRNDVLQYLKKRGLTDTTIADFGIGFASATWRGLTDVLREKGFTMHEIVRSGLAVAPQGGKDPYDRFRGRIMFPIMDASGRAIAFSGRIFEKDGVPVLAQDGAPMAKYINSPETTLYSKSKTLFAFDKAKAEIRKTGSCIIVEGQMDALMSHQGGMKNTVAVSGTALTDEQLTLLGRMTENLVMAFDADDAGVAASQRGVGNALAKGFTIRLVSMPRGLDPADIVLSSAEEWKRLTSGAEHIIDFYLAIFAGKEGDKRDIRKNVEREVLPYVARIESTIEQAHFVSRIAKAIDLSEDFVWDSLKSIAASLRSGTAIAQPLSKRVSTLSAEDRLRRMESTFIGLTLFRRKSDTEDNFGDQMIRDIELLWGKGFDEKTKEFSEHDLQKMLFEAEMYYNRETIESELKELFFNIQEHLLKGRLEKAMRDLKYAEIRNDEKLAEESLKTCNEVSRTINELIIARATMRKSS